MEWGAAPYEQADAVISAGSALRRDPVKRLWEIRVPAIVALLVSSPALAEEPARAEPNTESTWSLGISLFWYVTPGQKNFWVVNTSAEHGPLHIELRYHDEAIGTASTLIGWRFEFGETVKLGLMPSVGDLLGDEGGPIAGLDLDLSWGPLSVSSQHEWVWEVQTGKGWFFYSWTELDVRPWPWLRAGIATERTRLFSTARQFIFGPLVGFTFWKVAFSFFWFQPGGIDQTLAARLEVSF